MLKITRATNGEVVFKLSGRLDAENIGELKKLFSAEASGCRIVLDLEDLTLVDREVISFFARCEADGVELKNCPAYIRDVDHGRTGRWRRTLNGGRDMNSENAAVSDEHYVTAFRFGDDEPSGDGVPDPGTGLHSGYLTPYRFTEERECERVGFEGIVGSSTTLIEVLDLVRTVAPTDSTVLIEGETGTGKELIAGAIHAHSKRRDRRFVKLNCAAIPLGLLESELFGHERGAFTGAVARKIGRFEAADRGTLFLDEIGDIPLELQAKLLRVLQEGEFERLGSNQTQQVNVRVVAATNGNLLKLVSEKRFRSDLYYRLNVFPISVPPLRNRAEDIPPLVKHFVNKYAGRMQKRIDEIPVEAMNALSGYSWPGNIRELQNFIERSVILTTGNILRPRLEGLRQSAENSSPQTITLEEAQRDHICKTLKQTKGVIAGPQGAAARLGMRRSTLYFHMQKLGISRSRKNSWSI
jgi:DNA-binding NtrC family response regulator